MGDTIQGGHPIGKQFFCGCEQWSEDGS